MNTLRKIGFALYENWLIVALLFLALCPGIHFWPWAMIPVGFSILITYSNMSTSQFFAPMRMLSWPAYKKQMVTKANSVNNLFSYPAILWIEIEGKNYFLRGGHRTFQTELEHHLSNVSNKMQDAVTKMAETLNTHPKQ